MPTHRTPARLLLLAAVAALAAAPAASAHTSYSVVAQSVLGQVCWDVSAVILETGAVAAAAASGEPMPLGAFLAAAAGQFAARGEPIDQEAAAGTFRALLQEHAPIALTSNGDGTAAASSLLQCQFGEGTLSLNHQHVQVGSTEVQSTSDAGYYSSGVAGADWVKPSGIAAGVVALATIVVPTFDAGGYIGGYDWETCPPPILDAAALPFIHMWANGEVPLTGIEVRTTFCGFGVVLGGGSTDITASAAVEAGRDEATLALLGDPLL